MCGIAGFIAPESGRLDYDVALRGMSAPLRHRGPDASGFLAAPELGVGLSHQRLSIIDLTTGNQPIYNEDQSCAIVFNGEIYNYREIRRELIEQGHDFRTNSDTEVIVHLYEENGIDACRALDGIFSFCIFDRKKRRAILARDRLGVKPLYYYLFNGILLFASEIKGILGFPGVQARLSPEGLSELMTFQNYLNGRTLFKDIFCFPAGNVAEIPLGREIRLLPSAFWDVSFRPDPSLDDQEWIDQLRERLIRTVRAQLVSDVPVGGYLSGGFDSGSLVALAAKETRPFYTFTCGFNTSTSSLDEQKFDERVYAERLAGKYHTAHYQLFVDANEVPSLLEKVVWHLEDVRVGVSYPNYQVAELASQHVKVVLSGVGGDELFAGYPWRYSKIINARSDPEFDSAYYEVWKRFYSDQDRDERLWAPHFTEKPRGYNTKKVFQEMFQGRQFDHPLHRALFYDMKVFLHGLLIVADKLSMAHSIEERVPLLGNELVDFMMRLPPDLKYRGGAAKWVLQEAMKGILPTEYFQRPKVGFVPPDRTWFYRDIAGFIESLLLDKDSCICEFLDRSEIRRVLSEHGPHKDNRGLIWTLMCFEYWIRIFLKGNRYEN